MTDIVSAMKRGDTDTPPNSSERALIYLGNVTTDVVDTVEGSALLPLEFVVVLILAAACVVVGVVYAYVHITRAARARVDKHRRRPSTAASLHHHHQSRHLSTDDGPRQTHLMFFRRTTSSF